MSSIQPQGGQPDIQALLSQLGGQGAPPQAGPSPQGDDGNWLVDAINAVHSGMVEETDPQIVSMTSKILDLLTTVQAKQALPKPGQAATGG